MNNLFTFIIGVYVLICPFYLFESGVPQPAHYVAGIAFIMMAFSKDFRSILKDKIVLYLFLFVLLTFVINLGYYFKYNTEDGGVEFLFHSAYYIFNFLFFLLFLKTIQQKPATSNMDTISLFCVISLGIQVVLAILDVDKVTQYIVTGRSVLYFNNPNQLAYFTLLILTLFTILPSRYRQSKFMVLFVISGAVLLAIVASSRLVLVGVVLLALLLLYQLGMQLKLKYWVVIFLIGLIATSFLYKTEFIQKRIDRVEVRNHRQDTTGISEAQIRGYDRIRLHPNFILYGAGEGKYNRFLSHQKGELHSGFGTILFSYGAIGLMLFLFFFYKIMAFKFLYNALLLTPIILYNLAHQGFRNPLFWGVLAAVYVIGQQKAKTQTEVT